MDASMVRVGAWVTIKDGEREESWGLVDSGEADIGKRLISRDAPLARALLGHVPGDVVRVRTPFGSRDVIVLGVDEPSGTRGLDGDVAGCLLHSAPRPATP